MISKFLLTLSSVILGHISEKMVSKSPEGVKRKGELGKDSSLAGGGVIVSEQGHLKLGESQIVEVMRTSCKASWDLPCSLLSFMYPLPQIEWVLVKDRFFLLVLFVSLALSTAIFVQ